MPDWDGWVPEDDPDTDVSVRVDETSTQVDEEGRITQWGDGVSTTFYPPTNPNKYPTYTTLNGRPAINFDGREDGEGDYLDSMNVNAPLYTGDGVVDRILDDGFAIFIVGEQSAEPDEFGGTYDRGSMFRHSSMWINSHAPWDNGQIYFDIDVNHCYGAAGSDQATCEANGGEWHAQSRIVSNQWLKDRQGNALTEHQFIAQWTYDVQNKKQQIFKNGDLLIQAVRNRKIHIDPFGSIRLAQAGWHQRVVMGEVIILDFYPDQYQREKIEGYLAHKWVMTYLLDSAHPFKLVPPSRGETTLLQDASAGTNELTVHNQTIFNVGDYVQIDAGESNEEIIQLNSFGSLILSSNLQFNHSAGARIDKFIPPTPSPTPTVTHTSTPTPTITPTNSVPPCGVLPAKLPMELCQAPLPSPSATPTPTTSISTSPTPSITPSITTSITPTASATPTASVSVTPTPSVSSINLLTPLDNDIDVTVVDFNYVFDGKSSQDNTFGINKGTYTFKNVPESHPITFYKHNQPVRLGGMAYGGQDIGNDGNTYDYYYGDVILDVTGDFGVMSYECLNHDYMGGQLNLVFDANAPTFANQSLDVQLDFTTSYTENALSTDDFNTITNMANSFEESILNNITFPIELRNFTAYTSSVGGTLAYASSTGFQYFASLGDPNGPYGLGYWQSMGGYMAIDPQDVSRLREVTSEPNKNSMYWVMLHEVAHAFGIGFWNMRLFTNGGATFAGIANDLIRLTEADGAQYIGANAVREYNRLVNGNFASLPIQTFLDTTDPDPSNNDPNAKIAQNFISPTLTQTDINNGFILHNDPWRPSSLDVEVPIPQGTAAGQTFNYTLYLQWGGHWAEIVPDSGQRTLNGQPQPYIPEELMTPYISIPSVAPMSRITLAFLHDLGFIVDYSKIDPENQ